MRKHIIALMNEGISLDQIQSEVEKMFNEEYKKREAEQEKAKRDAALDAALDRMSQGAADYFNLLAGIETVTAKDCKDIFKEAENEFLSKGKPVVKQTKSLTKTDEEAIDQFLKSIGFSL